MTAAPLTMDALARAAAGPLAGVGEALVRAGFEARAVCGFFGVPLPSDARFAPVPDGRGRRGLGAAIRLLVAGEPVERAALGPLSGPVEALLAAGLVEESGAAEGRLVARVALNPFVGGALVVSDRFDAPGAEAVPPPDLSAWNVGESLPPGPASLLDVGCGAGAVLLAALRRGARVVGVDVDPRALAFLRLGLALGVPADAAAGVTALLGDVRALAAMPGLGGARFSTVVFNAPLVRAPLANADAAPLYLHAPGGAALPAAFFAALPSLLEPGGEALCHTQRTAEVWAAATEAGQASDCAVIALDFARAPDGTPHALVSLRPAGERDVDGVHPPTRFGVPLSAALPHLRREVVDRLHAAAALALVDDDALGAACARPAPWLERVRSETHDGHTFRVRALRFGGAALDDEDSTLLERADGRALAEAAQGDLARVRALLARGWLVP